MKMFAFFSKKDVVELSLKKKNIKKDKHDSYKNKSCITLSAEKINETNDISTSNDDDEKMSMIFDAKQEADATDVIVTKSLTQINDAVIYETDITDITESEVLTLNDNSDICLKTYLTSVTVAVTTLVLSDNDNSLISDKEISVRKVTVYAIAFHEWDLLD